MDLRTCGGLSTHVLTLQEHMRSRVANVILVDGSSGRSGFARLKALLAAASLRGAPRSVWLGARRQELRRSMARVINDVDLIHAHDPVAASVAAAFQRPVIMTCHGPMYEHAKEAGLSSKGYLALLRTIETEAIAASRRIIAVDTGQKDTLLSKGAFATRVDVVHNAVDTTKLRSHASAGSRMSKPYFLMARRLVPKNGPQFAVGAFLRWARDRDVRLVVAGNGPLLGQIKTLIARSENGRKVTLLGHVPNTEIFPLMSRAVATIVPSVPVQGVIEATSIAALESLALGTPVIASNIGGLLEIDRGDGVLQLVPPADVGKLMEAIEAAFAGSDEVDRSRLVRHVEKHFDVARWCDRTLSTYRLALES